MTLPNWNYPHAWAEPQKGELHGSARMVAKWMKDLPDDVATGGHIGMHALRDSSVGLVEEPVSAFLAAPTA